MNDLMTVLAPAVTANYFHAEPDDAVVHQMLLRYRASTNAVRSMAYQAWPSLKPRKLNTVV